MASDKPLKFTVVGDGTVGKTSLLTAFVEHNFPELYQPTVFECSIVNLVVDGYCHNIKLIDTAGQEDYAKLRSLIYPGTDCFILCYSIGCPLSLSNIRDQWAPELREFSKRVPIVLVGNKLDLISDSNTVKLVTRAEANYIRNKIEAYSLVECSAKTGFNVEDVFVSAVHASEQSETRNLFNCKCTIS